MDWSQYLPDGSLDWQRILLAVLAVLVGWIAAHFARKGTAALVTRLPHSSPTMVQLGARLTYYLVLLLGIGIAFAVLGANVQPLLGVVIVLAVIAVLVLRGVSENFTAGVLIQTRRTVVPGEQIQVEGPNGAITGDVVELNSRSVVLRTLDGRLVHVPNARLLSEPFVNASRHGRRRSEVQVRIGRDTSTLPQILATIGEAAHVDGVEPGSIRVLPVTVSSTRLTTRIQFWHASDVAVPLTADVVRALAERLESHGFAVTVTSDPGPPPLIAPDDV